jgi:adenylate cyclase
MHVPAAIKPSPSQRMRDLADWLAFEGNRLETLDLLFERAIDRLAASGLLISRVSLNLEILHPEIIGESRVWLCGHTRQASHLLRHNSDMREYVNSPVHIVNDSDQPFRLRLADAVTEITLLRRLQGEDFTDYAIFPMPVQDRHRSAAISFASKAEAGFSAVDFDDLAYFVAVFSPLVEARAVRATARNLLATYLGQDAGERVYAGRIQRGNVETIFAAILFCDLRNFTGFTASHPSDAVVARLNHWFGLAVEAVERHGGQVLKFIGDGMLAIFPADMLNPRAACSHALSATAVLADATQAWNIAPPSDQPPIDYGLSLHLGHVAFGNIGGPRRLDFTVVGPAVNIASRLLDVGKALGESVAVSAAFAGCSGRAMRSLGGHALKGLDQRMEIFTPL